MDGDANHDHTYYGYGCPDTEGSVVSCNLLIINTSDNEPQSIGTYHNFPSATSGSGSTAVTDNSNATDTFCPLGWQLPYSGTGGDYYDQSKSWLYLFDFYHIQYDQQGVNSIRSYPLSYIDAGIYHPLNGLYRANDMGYYYSGTVYSYKQAYGMRTTTIDSGPYTVFDSVAAVPLRCDCRISILNSFPWHPRSLISIMAFHFLKAHFPSVKIMSNYLKNETKYFIFMELRANFDEAESKYKMENRILMSE